jgi:hypothetical protein
MKNLVIILIAVLSLSGCDRVNPKNYPFYCKIDGKKFVPEKDTRPIGSGGAAPYRYEYPREDKKSMSFFVKNGSKDIALLIKLPSGKLEVGEYALTDDVPNTSYAMYIPNNNDNPKPRLYSQSGWIRITRADENGHFNGEFEFTTYNEHLGRTVKITDGKFRNN